MRNFFYYCRYNDVAQYFPQPTALGIINNERRRQQPRAPEDLADLDVVLRVYAPINRFYFGQIQGVDGSIGFVFGSEDAFNRILSAATALHLDANCQVNFNYMAYIR